MFQGAAGKTMEVLIVEDNPADVRMAQEALRLAGIPHHLHIALDGEQALLFLLREGQYRDAPKPDLVLLDLKLPRSSGFGLLQAIRAHRQLKGPIVVVLTGSDLHHDVARSREYAADLFVTKPIGVDEYVAEMKRFHALAMAA